MKTKTKNSGQREAYKEKASASTSYTEKNHDIGKNFKTEIETARKLRAEKEKQWAEFSKNIDINGVLKLSRLGTKEIKELAEWIKANSKAKIITLDLSNKELDTEGTKALAEALKTNTTITTLDLSYNDIGHEGAKALAEALKNNTTITTLDLVGNPIGDEGPKALAEALETNMTITKLDITTVFTELQDIINQQCALSTQRALTENNIAGALDLLTTYPNPHDGNITSIPEINDLIAQKLFVLDKKVKLNTNTVIKNPNTVFAKYT